MWGLVCLQRHYHLTSLIHYDAGDPRQARAHRRRRQKVLGHSFLVRFKRRAGSSRADGSGEEAPGYGVSPPVMEEASVLFARHNIGRKRARCVTRACCKAPRLSRLRERWPARRLNPIPTNPT